MKNTKELIERYVDGLYMKEEADRIEEALHSKEASAVIDKLSEMKWDEVSSEDFTSDIQKENYRREARRLLRKIDQRNSRRRFVRQFSIAASILILLGVGSLLLIEEYKSRNSEIQSEWMVVETGSMQRKVVLLSDGTKVTLNACSKLSYPKSFASDSRQVTLQGEAFFEVAKRKKHSFVVETALFDVKVLGTRFNIKSYQEDELQTVTVESGKVQVDMPEGMSRLTANEQFVLNTLSQEYSKVHEQATNSLSWIEGGLYFSKTPIQDVVRQISRVYNKKIFLQKDQSFMNEISGQHDNSSLTDILNSLSITSGIMWRNTPEGIELYK